MFIYSLKKYFITFLSLFFAFSFIYSNQADFFNSLSEKPTADFSDCIVAFCYLNSIEVTDNFDENVKNLQEIIPKMPGKYSAEKKLTVGSFSLLTAQYLNIKSGLFYLATKTGRYASRELFQLGIIPLNTSEWEKLSGVDLIVLLQKVVEYEEKKSSK